jgi:hypothetical protein
MQLLDLAEEILVLILESSIRPTDPRVSIPNAESLLTCRTFHHIGLPILYRTLLLKTSSNAEHVRRTLLERPTLVRHARHLYSRVTTSWLQPVLRAIGHAKGSLHILDFSISAIWVSGRIDGSDEEEPLTAVPLRRLAVRSGFGLVMLRVLQLRATKVRFFPPLPFSRRLSDQILAGMEIRSHSTPSSSVMTATMDKNMLTKIGSELIMDSGGEGRRNRPQNCRTVHN